MAHTVIQWRKGIESIWIAGILTGITSGNNHVLSSVYGKAVNSDYFVSICFNGQICIAFLNGKRKYKKVSRYTRATFISIWWHVRQFWLEIALRQCFIPHLTFYERLFSSQNFNVLDWAALSSDIIPIVYIWDILTGEVYKNGK